MGRQITAKKRLFAKHYADSGDVTLAALAAGYTGPQGCYRFIRKDDNGVIIDEVFRALLIEYGAEGITPVPPPVELPAGTSGKRQIAKILQLSEHRTTERGEAVVAPTLLEIRAAMWRIAEDEATPSGPRVQALTTLLKDAKDEFIPDVLNPEELRENIRLRLGQGKAS